MTVNARIADVVLRFEQFGTGNFWDMWQWKLDSFLATADATPEVTICRAQQELPDLSALSPVFQEQSGFFTKQVHRLPDGSTIWSVIRTKAGTCHLMYHLSPGWDRITLLLDETQSAGNAAFEYLCHIMPGVFLHHGLLTLHSALIEYQGKAFAVCAPSGTGKTTHARLWRDTQGTLILNGDRAVIQKEHEDWIAYGTPWCGTSGEYLNRHAPLHGIVVLERGCENFARRVSALEVLPLLLSQVLYPDWDTKLLNQTFDLLDMLLRDVPVYLLTCRPDVDAVCVLKAAMFGD